jgi:TonB family protein
MLAIAILLSLPLIAGETEGEKLLQAAKEGNTGRIRKLVEKTPPVDVNLRDEQGWSALMYAIRGGHDKTAKWLLENGANPGLLNEDKETSLIVATKYRRTGLLRELIEKSAMDIDIVDRRGWSAYTWAVFLNFEDGIEFLAGAGAKVKPPTEPLPFHRANEDGLVPPRLLKHVEPGYTREALDAGMQGELIVEVLIQKDGTPLPIRVSRSLDPQLDAMATQTAAEWRFEAATLDREPVEIIAEIAVDFKIGEKK